MTDQWAILELLGHRRIVGLVSECEIAGSGFLRIDVIDPEGGFKASQFYSPQSVYGITLTTEEAVRAEVERVKARPALTAYRFPHSDDDDPFDDGKASGDDEIPTEAMDSPF